MKRTHILCACALVTLVASTRESKADLRFSLSIGRTNSADYLRRQHESYNDRYFRYSAQRYGYPRYVYSPSYIRSRYYQPSYLRYGPTRYYYRPSNTLSNSAFHYGLSRSSYYYRPYSLGYADNYGVRPSGFGLGLDIRIGSSRRRSRVVAPPSDCCSRPYYCYGMGLVPSQPMQRSPVSPPAIQQPVPVPAPTPAIPAIPKAVNPPAPPSAPPGLPIPAKVSAAR